MNRPANPGPFLRDLTVPCARAGCDQPAEVELVLSGGTHGGCYCRRHGEYVLRRVKVMSASRWN